MNLLEKFLAKAAVVANREVVYGTLLGFTGFAPAVTKYGDKERISVTLRIGDKEISTIMFKDSVAGLPTYVPKEGYKAQITLQESKDGEYVNVIALGIQV